MVSSIREKTIEVLKKGSENGPWRLEFESFRILDPKHAESAILAKFKVFSRETGEYQGFTQIPVGR